MNCEPNKEECQIFAKQRERFESEFNENNILDEINKNDKNLNENIKKLLYNLYAFELKMDDIHWKNVHMKEN